MDILKKILFHLSSFNMSTLYPVGTQKTLLDELQSSSMVEKRYVPTSKVLV